MLQQLIGDTGIGGHHDDAVIELLLAALADQDVIKDIAEPAHGGAAYLFNGMDAHYASSTSS